VITAAIELTVLHLTAANGVAPYYPRAYDQVEYLTEGYLAFAALRDQGLLGGLAHTLVEPRVQGWLLQLEAGFLFLVTGPARLPALDLNIVHLVALLGITGTLLRRAYNTAAALAFAAVIVAAIAVTRLIGGVFDFRLDFAAMCLWGILVAILALADPRRLGTWLGAIAVVVAGELFISVRTIGFAYAAGLAIVLAVVTREAGLRRTLLIALAIWSVSEGAFVAQNWRLVSQYYLGDHLLDAQSDARSTTVGFSNPLSQLWYYPHSLLVDHLGPASELLLGVILLATLALCLRSAIDPAKRGTGCARRLRWRVTVLCVGIAVPFAALTLDPVKSNVVGGILLPPVAILAAVAFGEASLRTAGRQSRTIALLFAAGCLVAGLGAQTRSLFLNGVEFSGDGDVARASQFVLTLGDWVAAHPRNPTVWSVDAHLDFDSVAATRLYYFEQRGRWLDLAAGFGEGDIASVLSSDSAQAQATRSDVLVLTQRTTAPESSYPYDQSLERAGPSLNTLAATQFETLITSDFFGRQATGYVRRGPGSAETD
jgi:hypothetical protein